MKRLIFLVAAVAVMLASVMPASAAYTPTVNGCGPEWISVPNYYYMVGWFRIDRFPFVNACNQHDICYGTLGSNRAACDTQFYNNLRAICAANASTWVNRQTCYGLAWTYYTAVDLFGQSSWEKGQEEARRGMGL